MYRKTVDELQNDQREKLIIDIRSEEGNLSGGEAYFLGNIYGSYRGDTEGAAGVSVLLYRTEK